MRKIILTVAILTISAGTAIATVEVKDGSQIKISDRMAADSYLQKGHSAKNRGDLEKAIMLYKKALNANPDFSAAKSSLEGGLNELELKKWASKNLPEECQNNVSGNSVKCVEEYFTFSGEPIHPKIIETLNGFLSDGGDQIVSINLYDSQDSNRFCCNDDIKIRDKFIYSKEGAAEFGYKHIGKTESGIHVLLTYYSGGGSGVFINAMLIDLIEDYGVIFEENNLIIKANRSRLLIKNLGKIFLGDRWYGELNIVGNDLFIGKDEGGFAGSKWGGPFSEKPRDRVVKIDISR